MAEPVLELDRLEVRYGTVAAVRDVSLRVDKGEIVGLIGPNGAGKSTTLHAIMGVLPPSAGEVRLHGRALRRRSSEAIARAGVALVPEGRRIFYDFTVEENLRLGLAARRGNGGGDPLETAYDLFPMLREFRRRHAGHLSGGQQQQLAIARALVGEPKALLLDEPTEGIQPSIIKDIERAIRSLAAAGDLAILLVEQYYDFARSLHHQVLVGERARGAGADMDRDGVRQRLTV